MADFGNMWSWYPAFLSFFRHIAKLDLQIYAKWQYFEAAAIHGGPRIMHPDFCIISDRPLVLRVDEARRPHCADGPSHLWSDGFAIHHWHGYRLPETHTWLVTDKARITAEAIMAEPNAELRRIMGEIVEWRPLLDRAHLVSEDRDGNGHPRRLMEIGLGKGRSVERVRFVEVMNGSLEFDGSRRSFVLGAMPGETPAACIAASYGLNPAVYAEAVRT